MLLSIDVLIQFVIFCVVTATGNYSTYLRIPQETVIPTHYNLWIRPDFSKDIFEGEVKIYLRCNQASDKICLHSKHLNISETFLNQKKAIVGSEDEDKICIEYQDGYRVERGDHQVHIKYTGEISEGNTTGFRKAACGNGVIKYIYVTDFEPIHARTVFPCIDEPPFKATFSIRLTSPNDTFKAISNMPVIGTFKTPKGTVYDFMPSVPMSTYLVSFAFTEFSYYEEPYQELDRSIPIRVYGTNTSKENNGFAVESAKKALEFFTEYTKLEYPIPKLDMIEFRRQESTATENWGLITFREGLLSKSFRYYSDDQMKIVICHEISHFWFGNLVTNQWWNDIWLQEGFATYMSYKMIAKEKGTTQVKQMKDYALDKHYYNELYAPTKSVVSSLMKERDIFDKFTDIVYDKAAGVLLMLEDVVGEEKFKKIVQAFLKSHIYKTVTTNDFLVAVETVVPHINLRGFLESYLFQNRFPVVSIQMEGDKYVLTQQACETVARYSSTTNEKWTIPITYISNKSNATTVVWLDKDMETLEVEEPGAKWVMFNPFGIGMYKLNMSRDVWKNIAEHFEVKMRSENRHEKVYLMANAIDPSFHCFAFQKDYIQLNLFSVRCINQEERRYGKVYANGDL
ncbi:unnamed protein product [Acanthoscelides obtectus]|uniref:Aminopeptidase n=1 Tax=Acanthoscelides obtectus TaxID=200917 RepID=A0A9P0PES2_ACAOB|nr:unnamed protein product [Acanthoscelides obtectus]CAK1622104.1 Leucyl-cystinyl aminopeptidase [Acanthoscelides obtectus]